MIFVQLHMVINESMRLYPPASVLPRMVFEDIVLGDLYIPKGLSIWIPVLAIHHSEKLWGKDANEFNPERFTSKSFVPGRFLPFASGPRNCVGQAFALMEAKIILAMLISRFSFSISPNYRHAPVVVLTIKPKYGVQVCLKPLEPWGIVHCGESIQSWKRVFVFYDADIYNIYFFLNGHLDVDEHSCNFLFQLFYNHREIEMK